MGYEFFCQAAATCSAIFIALFISFADSELLLPHQLAQNSAPHEVIPIADAVGPESLAFDKSGGGPYTGISDGRVIKWDAQRNHWVNFAVTTPNRLGCEGSHDHVLTEARCGRPLGLSFNKRTGDLYIADAYMGLLVVGPEGGLATPIATEAQGIPFKFTNAVVVDQHRRVVYFTDTSTIFPRREYVSVIISGDKTGRLLKYDLKTKKVTVLLRDLMFPNGVALSKSGDYLLVVETTNFRVLKHWLRPSAYAGKVEVFAQLPGLPDNIQRNHKGEFWVAINAIRLTGLNEVLSTSTAPDQEFDGLGMAVKLNNNGTIVQTLEDRNGKVWRYSSEVHEKNGNLWIGSVVVPYVARLGVSS